MPATGSGSQAYRREVLSTGRSSTGISVATVIGFVAAADTGRFERAEDGERVGVYRHVLAGLDSSSRVIIVIIQATRRKKGAPIYRLY